MDKDRPAMEATPFDREMGLADALAAVDGAALVKALAGVLDGAVRLVSDDGATVLGDAGPGTPRRAPVRGELEPIGYVEAVNASDTALAAAAELVALLLQGATRYRMVSELHLQAVREDYAALQARNAALKASEERYRQLAAHLEERVAEQVRTIETAHRRLYQAEKLASVGQLAAGVAHEINNPIGFITSNLHTARNYLATLAAHAAAMRAAAAPELAAAWTRDDMDFVLDDFDAMLRECADGAQRIAHIVDDLKGFSHIDQEAEGDADINAIVRSVCNVAGPQVRERATVTLDLAEGLPAVHGQPAQLGQALLNLLVNAAQAIDGHGAVRIATSLRGGRVCVEVTDTGRGIPAEHLPRIFDPFFTTRDVGQGTGLGLTVCHDVIHGHGGQIEVESRPGAGTTFRVHLPAQA